MRLIDADALPKYTGYALSADEVAMAVENAPAIDAVPVRHEDDGTLWVTVEDCEKVGRVIVKNEQGHFCRVFYMGDGDEEPVRHGRWLEYGENKDGTHNIRCSKCGAGLKSKGHANSYYTKHKYRYCINCGAKMDEEKKMSCKTKAKAVLTKCDEYTDVIDRFEIVTTPSDYLLIIRALDSCNMSNDVDKERAKKLSNILKEF